MKIIEHNGTFFPEGTKTPHQNLLAGSEIYKKYIKDMIQTLADFHEFAEQNNILYSLSGGSLMGYYWNKDIMPWDDDIDVMVGEDDYFWLKKRLWDNGQPMEIPKFNTGWNSRFWRKITVCGKNYEFSTNHLNEGLSQNHLFKIIPISDFKKNRAGGLDVGLCGRLKNGKHKEYWTPGRTCCGPTNNFDKKLCPIVSFAGVTTRAIKRSFAQPYLDEIYGKSWVIPSHPKIKHLYNLKDYR